MSKVKGLVVLAAGLVLSGCVGMRDSIPIMGESEDGKQVVIAHATRTRLYTLSKAAEKIELWQVSSDKGVTMKGSDANSDSTSLVQVLERGIELGAALATARGVSPVGAVGAGGAIEAVASAPVVQQQVDGPSTARLPTSASGGILSGKISEAKSAGKTLVVVAGDPGCGYCTRFDRELGSSALPGRSDVVLVREIVPWASNSALAWTGGGSAPIVRVTAWNTDGSIACDTKLNRPSIADVEAAIGACVVK